MQAEINGVRLNWQEAGSGEAVVFLHAFPLNSSMWDRQLAVLPEGWRGIAPDLRGFGRSGGSAGGPYRMEDFATDVFGLLDHLGIQHAVLCGLSMGGYVAFAAHRSYASRIRGLILCNTRASADSAEARQARQQLAARVRAEGARAVVEAMLPKLLSAHSRREHPDLVGLVQQMLMANQPEQIARALEGMAVRTSAEPDFANINCPVLVIHGEEDDLIPTGEAQIMARGIRGARLQVITDAGHLSNLEQPSLFNRYVTEYLVQLPPFFSSKPG